MSQHQSLLAAKPDEPIDIVTVVSITSWSGSVGLKNYPFGFQLETAKHKTFNCGVDSEAEKEMWIKGVTECLTWGKANSEQVSLYILSPEDHVSSSP